MRDMTAGEVRAFLLEGTRTGKLAVVRPDGSPHVTPIWFVLDGEDVVFNTWHTSAKAIAMRAERRASLAVDDQEPPYAFVHMVGTVTFSEDLDEIVAFATRIGERYMGVERAEEFGRRNGVPGELVVRLTPHRIVAKAEMAQ